MIDRVRRGHQYGVNAWRVAVAVVIVGCATPADDAIGPSAPAAGSNAPVVPPPADTAGAALDSRSLGRELVVLDLNIDRDGVRDFTSLVRLLHSSAPDVATLQECDETTAAKLGAELGWSFVADPPHHLAILGPHPMTRIGASPGEWGGVGATVDLGRRGRVHVFDVHLDWEGYGPYLVAAGAPVTTILENEEKGRKRSLDQVFALMRPSLATGEPTFLAGDFNAPSHLDYDALPWPTSISCRDNGFVDSYRAVHPRRSEDRPPYAIDHPGITWSPLLEAETQVWDRIDFIYATANAKPRTSTTVDARTIYPWPSDHRAVVGTFELR